MKVYTIERFNYGHLSLVGIYNSLEEVSLKTRFDKIDQWQNNENSHELTCGVKSSHAKLEPRLNYDGTLMLVCPTCSHQQFHIPNVVLEME